MARIKFGKRIKNPFRKQNVGSSGGGANGGDDSSNNSISSGTSSLASDIRTHGPIDVDTCRKHGMKSSKSKGSGRRSKKKKDILSDKERQSLPKIVESQTSSRNSSPSISSQQNNDAESSSRSSTPRSSPQPQQPAPTKPTVEEKLDDSPGAQTVSTVNGLDVFERSRSGLSVVSTAVSTAAASLSASLVPSLLPPTTIPETETTADTTPPTDSSTQSPGILMSNWLEARVPSVTKRMRSGTPNSTSTAKLLEEAEMELAPTVSDSTKEKSLPSINEKTPPGSVSSNGRTKKNKELSKPSPTSVTGVFQPSTYHVELDPSMSISEESDKYSIIEEKPAEKMNQFKINKELPDRYDIKANEDTSDQSSPQGPQSQTPRASNASHQANLIGPPKINRMSPTKMFNDATSSVFNSTGWDPLRYQSLEAAVSAHAAMLTKPGSVGGNRRQRGETSSQGGGSISSGTFNTKDSKGSANKEFLALKKDAEKNEFKKVIMQLKKQAAKMEPLEEIELKAKDLDSILNSSAVPKEQTPPRSKKVDGKQTPPIDPPGVDAVSRADGPRDPPGVGVPSTRSVSPTPPSPNPFVEDIGSSALIQQDPKATQPKTETQTQSQQEQTSSNANSANFVVDVIQSFSFDGDIGMENSLSDDSCSYLSELESIGEITICEETTRLIEAHKLYSADAKTNVHHPARRSKSVMKVGSQFKMDKSKKTTSPKSATFVEQRGKKLTWYDDEENWNKPFTLRTDESFDASTVSSIGKGGLGVSGGVGTEKAGYNTVVDQFLGDFIKEIGKYAACAGNEDDVASFDVTEQQEI